MLYLHIWFVFTMLYPGFSILVYMCNMIDLDIFWSYLFLIFLYLSSTLNLVFSLEGRHAGTPLHHAAKRGLDQTVKLLLSHGGERARAHTHTLIYSSYESSRII